MVSPNNAINRDNTIWIFSDAEKTLFNVNKLPSPSEKVRKRCVEEAMLAFKNANIEITPPTTL